MKDVGLDLRRAMLLAWVALRLGVGPYLAAWFPSAPRPGPPGVRLRLALERLGLTYVKFGQFLAMRIDILPIEICRELDSLFENVRPAPFSEIRATIERELGGPLERWFAAFTPVPIAAASVAQVHSAQKLTGERVAVKIQRDGIRRIFAADMRILQLLARPVDAFGLFGTVKLGEILGEFNRWTLRELDFRTEGETADRLRSHAQDFEIVPRIYWDSTTECVLTMELVDGISLAEMTAMLRDGREDELHARLPNLDPDLVVKRVAFASFHQLFVTGFFHGDPHPGNVLVRGDNTVAFVDFGIFGELSEYERALVANYLEHFTLGNIGEALNYYSRMLQPTPDTNLQAYRRDLYDVMERSYQITNDRDAPMEDRHIGKGAGWMFEVIRHHRVRMNLSLLLFWRTIFAINSTALRFSPRSDLIGTVRTFFEETRPNVGQRLLAGADDDTRMMIAAELARGGADGVRQTLAALLEQQWGWRATVWESDRAESDGNREARTVALALAAISVALVGRAAPVDLQIGAIAVALALPALLWAAVRGGAR